MKLVQIYYTLNVIEDTKFCTYNNKLGEKAVIA
jgi:hypothetical protein